jgi:DNA helicase-2/ATP-dependent DNA helicase PcrA
MKPDPQELQKIIANTDGPQVINAGPGTGKTEVVASRVAYLINDKGIFPRRIMCVTFTNNAADEMKERIANYTNANISAMLVGTFHSICGHILGEYNHRRLIIPGFKILSESEAYWCLKSALSKDASPVETESIAEEISRFKRSMTGLDAYARSLPDPEQAARFKKLYKLYQKQLLLADSYDFDDLTREAVLSLQKDRQLLTKIATGFSYIFVDEYQDASHAEASLVRLLYTGCPNLCVVGDSRQAIFGWRGADPRLIEQFKKLHRGTISHKLCINHRSTKQIVETSNRLMAASTNRHRSISTPAGASDGKVTVTSYANERIVAYKSALVVWGPTAIRLHIPGFYGNMRPLIGHTPAFPGIIHSRLFVGKRTHSFGNACGNVHIKCTCYRGIIPKAYHRILFDIHIWYSSYKVDYAFL